MPNCLAYLFVLNKFFCKFDNKNVIKHNSYFPKFFVLGEYKVTGQIKIYINIFLLEVNELRNSLDNLKALKTQQL